MKKFNAGRRTKLERKLKTWKRKKRTMGLNSLKTNVKIIIKKVVVKSMRKKKKQ